MRWQTLGRHGKSSGCTPLGIESIILLPPKSTV
jgi:hypothetical protein